MFELNNRVCVVFGGSGYLGVQFCQSLLKQGGIVYCCDLIESRIVLDESHVDRFYFLKVDKKDTDYQSIAKYIFEKHGRIDVLVNSTTSKYDDFYKPFEEVSLKGWEVGLHGNLTIPFLTCQAIIPYMRKVGKGSIINISSIYGVVANDQRLYEGSNLHELYVKESPNLDQIYSHGVYNASKGGLNMFSKYLAAYYGKDKIRVNILTPGGVYYKDENEVFVKKYSLKTPLGRKANPDEMNGALIFLASDASSYVTGHNLIVDGGFSIW